MLLKKDFERLRKIVSENVTTPNDFQITGERENIGFMEFRFRTTEFTFHFSKATGAMFDEKVPMFNLDYTTFPGMKNKKPAKHFHINEIAGEFRNWVTADINLYLEDEGLPLVTLVPKSEPTALRQILAQDTKVVITQPTQPKNNTENASEKTYSYFRKHFLSIILPISLTILGGVFTIGYQLGQVRYDTEKIELNETNKNLMQKVEGLESSTVVLKDSIQEILSEIETLNQEKVKDKEMIQYLIRKSEN